MYLNQGVFELNNLLKLVEVITEKDKIKLKRMIDFTQKAFKMTIDEKAGHLTKPAQGDIWTVDLGENIGSEMCKIRPCVVIQSNELNLKLNTTFVIPISNRDMILKDNIEIKDSILEENTSKEISGIIVQSQARTVSIARLGKKIGALNKYGISEVKKSLLSITN